MSKDDHNPLNVVRFIFVKVQVMWELCRLLSPELDWDRLTVLACDSLEDDEKLGKAMAEVRKMAEVRRKPRVDQVVIVPSDGQLHNEGRGAGIF